MKRALAILRLLSLTAAMFGIVVGLTLQSARAHLKEFLGGFGHELSSVASFSPHSAPRQLSVNGLEFSAMTIATELGVADALDRFERLCHASREIDLPEQVRKELEARSSEDSIRHVGVVREESSNEGYLGCLDVGAKIDAETLVARLLEFGTTLNLRALGQLRYAIARRSGNVTTLLVVWTDGNAKLSELFPKTGDAPGRDLDTVPRPTGSQRLLSASEQGKPFGLALYRAGAQSRAKAQTAYEAQLVEQGWQLVRSRKDPANGIVAATKANRKLLVSIRERQAGKVTILLSDLG